MAAGARSGMASSELRTLTWHPGREDRAAIAALLRDTVAAGALAAASPHKGWNAGHTGEASNSAAAPRRVTPRKFPRVLAASHSRAHC
jgi:hypothetical protein